jgi:hypothetical protein
VPFGSGERTEDFAGGMGFQLAQEMTVFAILVA